LTLLLFGLVRTDRCKVLPRRCGASLQCLCNHGGHFNLFVSEPRMLHIELHHIELQPPQPFTVRLVRCSLLQRTQGMSLGIWFSLCQCQSFPNVVIGLGYLAFGVMDPCTEFHGGLSDISG